MIVKRFTSQFIRLNQGKACLKAASVLISLLFFSKSMVAQLQTNTNVTLDQLVSNIIGPGYNTSNIKLNCANGAFATFTSGGTLGINNGILLTTGLATNAKPPNNNIRESYNNGTPGDSQLDVLLGTETYDGCALEFDLVPSCDTLKIKYVFGTEEFPDYVGSTFNDVFCFFVSGPGITGSKNIATVPGTNTPVTINTINQNSNTKYFVDNRNNAKGGTEYNGYTIPMWAVTPVVACSTYHLKIVIADVVDGSYDSGVFIESQSISCAPVIYNNLATNVNGVRGCKNGSFTFCRTGDRTNAYDVPYTIGGTAVAGQDYQALSGTVTIPAGEECASVEVVPLPSGSPKPLKTIEITYKYGFCPLPNTIVLTLTDPIPLDAGPDKIICSGDSIDFGPRGTGAGTTYSWSPKTGLSNPNIARPTVSLTNNTNANVTYNYVLTATVDATNCVVYDTVAITVRPHPFANFYDNSKLTHCLNSVSSFRDTSTAIAGTTIVDWYWEFGNNLFDTVQHTSTTYTQAGIYNVKLVVTDNNGCVDDTIMPIEIYPLPEADFKAVSACIGDSVAFVNTTKVSNGGTVVNSLWNFGDGSGFVQLAKDPKHLYDPASGVKNYTVQLITTSDHGCIGTVAKAIEIYPKPTVDFKVSNVCLFTEVKFNNYSDGNMSVWDLGDGTTSAMRNPSHYYTTSGVKTVKLAVTNNYGCTDSLTKTLTVFPQPKFDFVATDTAGCPIFITQFFALKDTTGSSDSIIQWKWIFNPANIKYGPQVESAPYHDAGRFSPTLIATSINGCTDTLTKEYYIHVYPEPIASFSLSPNELSIYDMKTQIIDNSSSDVTSWDWGLGDGTKEKNKTKFYHDYSSGNEPFYTITLDVKNKFGCVGNTSRVLRVRTERAVYIPNAFTPNGDGVNDKFMPYASGDYLNADFQMRIFDRWGNKLLFSGDLNQGWNGYFKGQLCERDVYVYTVVFTNKEDGGVMAKFKGIVTLVQ